MSEEVYLDWAATAVQDKKILEDSVTKAIEFQGNPSARHDRGYQAHEALEESRNRCAHVLNCSPEYLYFTSGGTESNNAVILSRLLERNQGQIIVSSLEHPSVTEPAELLKKTGTTVKIIKPDGRGIIEPDKLAKYLTGETKMISIMTVHNETGVIQPLKELVSVVRAFETNEGGRPIHFHSDMVQAPGKIGINLLESGIDSASFSAHKLGGPKGVGLLYLKKKLAILNRGGGQEKGIRSGTESIQNAEAMALSLEKWGEPAWDSQGSTYKTLFDGLKEIGGLVFNPPARQTRPELFVPAIINFSLPPLPGEVLQRILNERGFYISTGSACSSNKKSHTKGLLTMGISEKTAHCSVRISLGPSTSINEVKRFLSVLKEIHGEYTF
jgi:cysteine desulfurase